ncbi:hypothetical protein N6L26_06240 [Qipengyuania sp. SS22]|uniref:hypothetical protein n=1 Tax=Qipengyuania sp. SS22 TaxID=2979461 RepID=UPI0021E5EDEE|nr:hypothetical protein [Qipengyuania sp. SS22]UYH56150.1 hypothetical protein N6L26_06240 [Qipengyuania sp. SS22]
MQQLTKTFAKGGIATAAVGAMALAGATPAQARGDDDGISVGEVIAGAVIIGGIAAIASAASKNRDHHRDGRYYRDGQRYNHGNDYRRTAYATRGNPRSAVKRCVSAAQADARRYGYRLAQVTDIRDVDDTRYGWKVKGTMVVDGQRGYNSRYDRRDRRYSNRDRGSFTCSIERGRVTYLDFSGIRGLR